MSNIQPVELAKQLRLGNYVNTKEHGMGIVTELYLMHDDAFKIGVVVPPLERYAIANATISPIPLTEDLIMKLRCVEHDDFKPLVFAMYPPGERQMENQFWSRDFNDDYKLHLTPTYEVEYQDGKSNPPVKTSEIKFWFCWISSGYSGPSVSVKPIRGNVLKYVHQLQNLYHSLTGKDLQINL